MDYIRILSVFTVFALMIVACDRGHAVSTSNAAANSNRTGTVAASSTTGTTGASTGSKIVSPQKMGVVILHWKPPTTWADGTPAKLSSIKGYQLLYGPTPVILPPHRIDIDDAHITRKIVRLPIGLYYFYIRAVDTKGNPGLLSVVKPVTVQ